MCEAESNADRETDAGTSDRATETQLSPMFLPYLCVLLSKPHTTRELASVIPFLYSDLVSHCLNVTVHQVFSSHASSHLQTLKVLKDLL